VVKAPVFALWHLAEHLTSPVQEQIFLPLGLATAVAGGFFALSERDGKRILGFSSIAQMGFIVAAFSSGSSLGRTAALLSIVAHSLYKGLLFLTVGDVLHRTGSRDVEGRRGLQRLFPYHALLYTVGALGLIGAPLFAGYGPKKLVSEALSGHPLSVLILPAGILASAAVLRIGRMFTGGKAPGRRPSQRPAADGEAARADLAAAAGATVDAATDVEAAAAATRSRSAAFAAGSLILAAAVTAMGVLHHAIVPLASSLVEGTPVTVGPLLPERLTALGGISAAGAIETAASIAAAVLLMTARDTAPGRAAALRVSAARTGLNGSLRLLTAGFLVLFFYTIAVL
jgi:formate hydrogenlyase subunit 3/multisubunit Na+/H+ antiporter MnhD subunit